MMMRQRDVPAPERQISQTGYNTQGTVHGPFHQPGTKVAKRVLDNGDWEVVLRNESSHISFFNRLQVRDAEGNPLSGSYYSDNFFSLLPHGSKTVIIRPICIEGAQLYLEGWNSK